MNSSTTPVAELDGLVLADVLRAGIYRLFEKTDHINKINVFPVPDGDTGTNMSMTLSAVLGALDRQPEPHAGSLLVRAADAALDGARGNSGAILAQFLLGLGDGAGHLARVGVNEFVTAVTNGANYARDAMSQPREGTLLTVLREFALAAQAQQSVAVDFRSLFVGSLGRVRTALEQTRGQLEELRAANVVHAGEEVMIGSAAPSADQDFRFCTECLVAAPAEQSIDLRQLRETLAPLGASLVVSGSTRKARIHVHVDEPDEVFRIAGSFGTVSAQKADDMRMQQSAAHHQATRRIAVTTDSGADLPEEIIERLGIHVVPARIHFGNRSYLDKVSMTPAEFYRELLVNPEHPKTSQPPPGDFRRTFEFLASHYQGIVSINLTSRHSGTYNAAVTAGQRVSSEGKPVTVIDSLNASTGEGLIVLAAAEAAARGADMATVEQVAREAAKRTRTFALLRDVRFGVRGGRVPAIVGKIARGLRLTVILRTYPDGRVAAGGGLFGPHRLRERFAKFIVKNMSFDADSERLRVLIGCGLTPADGHFVAAELERRLPAGSIESIVFTEMGPAIGVHGGPETILVALQPMPRG